MATAIPAATEWSWPADVLAFAAQNQAQAYLDPLRDLLRRLYPTARSFRAFIEFDPEIHEAVEIVTVPEDKDNQVIEEFQMGYKFGDRLLRPARVRVGYASD